MLCSGTVVVEWDPSGHLNIKSSLPLVSQDDKKLAIEKLLDAARAINNRGTGLEIPTTSSARILSAKL